ncbi:valyl-tRNA synthetase [Candidatus Phytoplasma luffae]|uniref:Valine--tRNA ligase n=1 Tax=Loofah witches'-broom phytoplasma TaxID=35773 RepID=A0A975INN5_LOWBP|nr:valine--tRNA ligase [Candidatus Phytoplasma luffae]QTX03081.1 valyl-tRNA synthetase [Candidatus Phytoplasma luffae]
MKSKYDFKLIEKNRYQKWLNENHFQTENVLNKKAFTIAIPPPNITGQLHLGHAWNNFLQDIIIRNKKMSGYDVLFLPGMDHAGIATQAKIKQKLKEKGFSEKDITKELFLKYASLWKEEYSDIIRKQWSDLGLFMDYKYEKFTLDPPFQKAVTQVFIKLYKDNLIYRDYKIINWDPCLLTTLSNIEVQHKQVEGNFFYLKYFLVNDSNIFLEVATTRPETIFADQALAVNPEDSRYNSFIDRKVVVPYTNSHIDVIADSSVDITFGTGIVKITPAHDENDFQIGKKNNLKFISCINKNNTMNKIAKKYENLTVLECRQKLILDLQEMNLVSKIEKHLHMVGFSSISGAVIEPRLSLQWFLKSKELSLSFLKENKINFFPKRFLKIFNAWLEDPEDWCISRQLWWGHSIPVWYKDDQIKIQESDPGNGFVQDSDVLDTWFSSSLWPLITLEWPNIKEPFFQRRFPLDVLVTGYDILTFWVAKMAFQSFHLTNQTPFKNVLLHGLIRDEKGQKMSKSKGNGIIPKDIIEQYGADTLRWFLTTSVSNGSDLCYDKAKIMNSWNFINKIWNIGRWLELNLTIRDIDFELQNLLFPEKALLFQFSQLIKKINNLYKVYEFNTIGELLYHFVWEDFGNWYLEFLKIFLKETKNNLNSQKFLLFVFHNILKLLHPHMPFVTDAIYEKFTSNKSIVHSDWPKINYSNSKDFEQFQIFKKLITKVRYWKKNNKIQKKDLFKVYIKTNEEQFQNLVIFIPSLTKFFQVNQLELSHDNITEKKYFCLESESDISIWIDREFWNKNNIEMKKNFIRQKEILLSELKRSENILNNKSFLEKANSKKIKEEKDKYQKYLKQYKILLKNDVNI